MICGAFNKEQLRGQMLTVDTDFPVVAKLTRLARIFHNGSESPA
jgi:hypothetical protein